MKRSDLIVTLIVITLLSPFFIFDPVYQFYHSFNLQHAYVASFLKFALLATFGEVIGLRIREGFYSKPGFGFFPRALVWGVIGLMIKSAFVIFADAAPYLMGSFGILSDTSILRQPDFSWMKILTAFIAATFMNIYFAPMFMTFHKITDMHINETGGTLKGFFTPFDVAAKFRQIDWVAMWNFVFKKTLIFFWIPAQTINFMLPEHLRTLVAAVLGVVLGILLSVSGLKKKKDDTSHSDVQAEGISIS